MPPFVRFIITVIVIAVCCTLGIVLYTQQHIRKFQELNAKRERTDVENYFVQIDKRVRRADMVVASEVVSGDKSVQETKLIFQRYGVDAGGSSTIPLKPQVLTIQGNSPVVRAEILKFDPKFQFAGDFADYSHVVAGKTIYLFEDVHSKDSLDEGTIISGNADVPISCQVNPNLGPSGFEKGLWHKIWDLAREPAAALRNGLELQKIDSLPIDVSPGMVYQVWIQGDSSPIIHEDDNPQRVAEMLRLIAPAAKPVEQIP